MKPIKNVWMMLVCLSVVSCGRASSEAAAPLDPIARNFRVTRGEVELRGSFTPLDGRDADADVVLDVHSASRNAEAKYNYHLRVHLAGDDPIELCMRDRHMYAMVPRQGLSWRNLLTSSGGLEDGLDVIRLDGAGEED